MNGNGLMIGQIKRPPIFRRSSRTPSHTAVDRPQNEDVLGTEEVMSTTDAGRLLTSAAAGGIVPLHFAHDAQKTGQVDHRSSHDTQPTKSNTQVSRKAHRPSVSFRSNVDFRATTMQLHITSECEDTSHENASRTLPSGTRGNPVERHRTMAPSHSEGAALLRLLSTCEEDRSNSATSSEKGMICSKLKKSKGEELASGAHDMKRIGSITSEGVARRVSTLNGAEHTHALWKAMLHTSPSLYLPPRMLRLVQQHQQGQHPATLSVLSQLPSLSHLYTTPSSPSHHAYGMYLAPEQSYKYNNLLTEECKFDLENGNAPPAPLALLQIAKCEWESIVDDIQRTHEAILRERRRARIVEALYYDAIVRAEESIPMELKKLEETMRSDSALQGDVALCDPLDQKLFAALMELEEANALLALQLIEKNYYGKTLYEGY